MAKTLFFFDGSTAQDITIPTKTSQLTNDSDLATKSYVDSVIAGDNELELATYAKKADLKTINGESIIGTGDIKIVGGGRHLFGPMCYKSSRAPTIQINTLVTKPMNGDSGVMYITECQIVGTNFVFYGYEFPNSMTFDAFVNSVGTTDLFTWIGKDGAFSLNCYIL